MEDDGLTGAPVRAGFEDSAVTHGGIGSAALDMGRYRAMADDFDLPDAQAVELLETLWSIMRSFVELGFDVELCGPFLDRLETVLTNEPGDVG